MGSMSATGQVRRRAPFEPLAPGIIHVELPTGDAHGADEIARVIEREGPRYGRGLFLAEPVVGGGGVHVPPDDYFSALREVCDHYGCLLMFDEVITNKWVWAHRKIVRCRALGCRARCDDDCQGRVERIPAAGGMRCDRKGLVGIFGGTR